jgi:hypothetical protein
LLVLSRRLAALVQRAAAGIRKTHAIQRVGAGAYQLGHATAVASGIEKEKS